MPAAVRILVLPVQISLVPACYGYIIWIYPGKGNNNLTCNYVDVVYFRWASDANDPWVNLWCAPSPSEPQSKDYGNTCAQVHAAYKTVKKSPKNGGSKRGHESSHCMKRNGIPKANADQGLKPSIIPL